MTRGKSTKPISFYDIFHPFFKMLSLYSIMLNNGPASGVYLTERERESEIEVEK